MPLFKIPAPPLTAVVSLMYVMESGASAEIAVVEELVGSVRAFAALAAHKVTEQGAVGGQFVELFQRWRRNSEQRDKWKLCGINPGPRPENAG